MGRFIMISISNQTAIYIKKGVFDNISILKTAILRYDLFYFGDFQFKDGTKMSDNYPLLKQQFGFKDIDNLQKNAFVGCFILRNSKAIRHFFDNDFLRCFECIHNIRKTQESLLWQIKRKKKGIWSYSLFLINLYWNALLFFLFSIRSNKKIKLCAQIIVALLSVFCIMLIL